MGLLTGDTHIHKGKTEYVTREVNITEKRAPTDESVRLLHDFENKARKKLISAFELKHNELQAIVFWEQVDSCINQCIMHIRFKLNNKDYEFSLKENRFDINDAMTKAAWNIEEAYKFWFKKLSEVIAVELIKSADINKAIDRIHRGGV